MYAKSPKVKILREVYLDVLESKIEKLMTEGYTFKEYHETAVGEFRCCHFTAIMIKEGVRKFVDRPRR